jgi:energy-coupling factor transport system permease protein
VSARRSTGRDRSLHPGAWWLWAAGLATAAVQTTNPIILLLIGAVVCFVVAARRGAEAWSRSLVLFLRVGLVVIVLRVVLQVLFGDRVAGHVLFSLPRVPLPSWAAGVSIGGPVTAEMVLQAFDEGLRLAVMLLAFGAANSLASPYRLLRCLPAVLYEAGVAVTVALSYAPELVISIGNVREARRLRGRPIRGFAGLRGLAVPVLEGALDRSLELASSMDARGYGRRSPVPASTRRWGTAATGVGLLAVMVGVYNVLSSSTPWDVGIGALLAGVVLLGVGIVLSGRRTHRTRYRPDVWRSAEWAVAASGVGVIVAFAVAGALHTPGIQVTFSPLAVPPVPPLLCVGALIGLAPAYLAPPPARQAVAAVGVHAVPSGLASGEGDLRR